MMEKPKSVIKIDFVEGTSILEALSEMKEKANFFNVAYIYARINDIDIYVRKDANISEAFTIYQNALRENKDFICV